MKTISNIFILALPLFFFGCTQELSIADFADDFESYEVEYRIEGLLNYSDFSLSVIRVDRTILVTDTSLFNNRDDNGDWQSYSDLNGNNKWDENEPLNDDIGIGGGGPNAIPEGRGNGIADPGEPGVDDYNEVLPHIHDSTMTSVVLRDAGSQELVAEFEWQARAASFDESYGPGGPPAVAAANPYKTFYYGAYVPAPGFISVQLDSSKTYTVEITSVDGQLISATTDIIAGPRNLSWDNTTWEADTLVSPSNNYSLLTWNNPIESFYGSVEVELYFRADSIKDFYHFTRVAFQLDEANDLPLFRENFTVGFPLGLYLITINSYNDDYGSYIWSSLPIRDREVSNWRDQDGNVVLGNLGSAASIQFYLRLGSTNG
ncbi:MAG: hypothetical protein HQ506_02100 [Candidatus Marinimicrobia bacterium]|nr:hypothetical protein [Candidatus Neomarinimicrobiota bacterium]